MQSRRRLHQRSRHHYHHHDDHHGRGRRGQARTRVTAQALQQRPHLAKSHHRAGCHRPEQQVAHLQRHVGLRRAGPGRQHVERCRLHQHAHEKQCRRPAASADERQHEAGRGEHHERRRVFGDRRPRCSAAGAGELKPAEPPHQVDERERRQRHIGGEQVTQARRKGHVAPQRDDEEECQRGRTGVDRPCQERRGTGESEDQTEPRVWTRVPGHGGPPHGDDEEFGHHLRHEAVFGEPAKRVARRCQQQHHTCHGERTRRARRQQAETDEEEEAALQRNGERLHRVQRAQAVGAAPGPAECCQDVTAWRVLRHLTEEPLHPRFVHQAPVLFDVANEQQVMREVGAGAERQQRRAGQPQEPRRREDDDAGQHHAVGA